MTNSAKYLHKKNWYTELITNKSLNKKGLSFEVAPKCELDAFSLYFTEDCQMDKELSRNIHAFQNFIDKNLHLFPLARIKKQNYFSLNLKLVLNDAALNTEWKNFKDDVTEQTDMCLKCMGLAMHKTIIASDGLFRDLFPHKRLYTRLFNVEPIINLSHLKSNLFGKLVSIRGTVIKVCVPKYYCQYMLFKCSVCDVGQIVKQNEGNFTFPLKCCTKSCKSHNFTKQLASAYTKIVNYQVIKLQEIMEDVQEMSGRVPRTVECDLTEDLVGYCIPGDEVILTGVVKVRTTHEDNCKVLQPPIFLLYLDCISVVNEKANFKNISCPRVSFNSSDIPIIQKIHSEPRLFWFLVNSLCPSIYGHEMVKAGLLLALFGGTRRESEKRPDCHVLVVGDPGLGKSQMLQACSNVSPRGVYVCGNTSTGSGLTVTMVRESGGEFSLDAGALILADHGCCCIDEFDKMTNQYTSLLEVMEQQRISIAKAGISRSLPARVSLLAAANPFGGHYNKGKTVAENLKIGSPLLSRFDLIFIILDQPHEDLDMLLSDHVLALHAGRKSHLQSYGDVTSKCNTTLRSRLILQPGEKIDHLPHLLFRKYIAYAQKFVHPQLNKEAKSVLKQFYLELRERYHVDDSTPVTARQLESMKRLTQAKAKLELRNEATVEDAIEVVEIMRHSLVDVFTDELGVLDFTRSPNGSGISNKKQTMNFLNILQQKSEFLLKSTFHTTELQEFAKIAGIAKNKFYRTIESLNISGMLLFKGNNSYQLVSSDY